MSEDIGRELGWDDAIENDGPEFITLPEGDYDFEVVKFERGRHQGSDKLPPCNKAILHIKINAPEGTAIIQHNLFLHTKTEGLLCAFFTAIGQRKHGERLNMNWNTVVGSKGRCKVGIREWVSDKGNKITSNQINKFYDPADQPAQETMFKPGEF